jgi:hypothetical protein
VAFQVIVHKVLGFPQRHLQGSGNLKRRGVLTETGEMFLIEWGM